jgi:hypothetical protein
MSFPVPPQVERLQRGALVAAGAGLGLCVLGFALDPAQFFRSYLVAFLFWSGLGIGSLSVTFIHHMTGGLWGMVIRRLLEAATRTFPVLLALFLPLLLGLPQLYVWARPDAVAGDALLSAKALYLNVPFFVARAAFYFAVWLGLAHLLNRWSLQLDAGYELKIARRLRGLAGGGLLLMGLTITFASIDWGMSLDAHWFSTIYGVLFMVGTALSALIFAILMVALLGAEAPFAGVVQREQVHDLGKLTFAFVMLWGYVNYSQFLITWAGNLPEEIPWYLRRFRDGWQVLAWLLVVLHLALPFLLLLSRAVKRNLGLLARVAGVILFMRLVDVYWLIGPDLGGHGEGHAAGLHLHWLDAAAVVGVGGAWLWAYARQLRTRPLLPLTEPEMLELTEPVALLGRHA